MIERPPFEHNIYLNPQYYYDFSISSNKEIQEWLDKPIKFKENLIDSSNITVYFETWNKNYYPILAKTEIKTFRELLFFCYKFYLKHEIDKDFVLKKKMPIETGYWFFYLDLTGCFLDKIEISDINHIFVHLKSPKGAPNKPTNPDIVDTRSYLCKQCYTLHIKDLKKCPKCNCYLIMENRKYS